MKDDYQKKFTLPLATNSELFIVPCQSLYDVKDVKQKAQLELCAIRFLIANYCMRRRYKGLPVSHRLGGGRDLLKISAPPSLLKTFRMRPL